MGSKERARFGGSEVGTTRKILTRNLLPLPLTQPGPGAWSSVSRISLPVCFRRSAIERVLCIHLSTPTHPQGESRRALRAVSQ